MPVYLLHGFRWPREQIRIHIILQNLDDAAAEWLVAPATSLTLLRNFNEIYPDCMDHLHQLRFVEQYDPNDTSPGSGSQPYAYVADVCEEVKLGMDIDEVRGRGVPNDQWAAMMELRDKLASEEKVAWYIVVCGDEDRWAPGLSVSSVSQQQGSSIGPASQNESDTDRSYEQDSTGQDDVTEIRPTSQEEQQQQQPKGLKKFFSGMSKRKSSRATLGPSKSYENVTITQPGGNHEQEPLPHHSQKLIMPNADLDSPKTIIPYASSPQKAVMPKLQTHDLNSKASDRTLNAHEPLVSSPGALSLMPEVDEDQEVITGPTFEDDPLAAPSPTVKHGKQQDLVARQRKRSSIHSLKSSVRGTSPETLRNISPIVRSHPNSFSNFQSLDEEPSSQQFEHTPHALQHELQPEDIDDPPPERKPKSISPPASYVPTGIPSGVTSVHTSRSSSPVKVAVRQRSNSRISALNALEGNGSYTNLSSSPPRRGAKSGPRSRRSSIQTTSGLNQRGSSYSLSSMSGTMSALYGAHEKKFKDRQSVTQDDLIARGLDNMDFGALR